MKKEKLTDNQIERIREKLIENHGNYVEDPRIDSLVHDAIRRTLKVTSKEDCTDAFSNNIAHLENQIEFICKDHESRLREIRKAIEPFRPILSNVVGHQKEYNALIKLTEIEE